MPVISREYRDLDLNFTAHPNTKNINVLEADRAIVRSIRNLLLTQYNEKPFHPEIGSNITSYLFELADSDLQNEISSEIVRVVSNHEPRVSLRRVDTRVDPDNYGIYVTLVFYVVGEARQKTVELFLERAR